jgi:hypothetical protein
LIDHLSLLCVAPAISPGKPKSRSIMCVTLMRTKRLRLFEIASVLVRLDYVARFIVNAAAV